MRRQSLKRQKLMREIAPWRKEFIQSVGICEICGAIPHLVHEISRGIHREESLNKPYAVLVLCTHCHDDIHTGIGKWPLERQLAALGASRPGDFNLEKFNILRGREPGAIDFLDLLPYLELKWT